MRKSESDMLAEIEQYVGKEFPNTSLTILGFAGRNKRRQILVECSSESRGVFTAVWNDIKRGKTKGARRGLSRIIRNKYEVCDNYVKVFFKNGSFFLCDPEDIGLVEQNTWYLNQNGYARSSNGDYFHRMVIDIPDGRVVDHINRDKLDNRKQNQRACLPLDNCHNRGVYLTNTSGHTGVYKLKNGTFAAEITANYKHIHLGKFKTYEEACETYDDAREQHHKIGGES